MPQQLQIDFVANQADCDTLVALLQNRGWLTRAQISELTGWSDRTIRQVAEAAWDAGQPRIIRGPLGFAVPERATVDQVNHCAEISISQAKKMMRYGFALKRLAHQKVA